MSARDDPAAHIRALEAEVERLRGAIHDIASNLPRERHRGKRNDGATLASVARYLDGLAEGRDRR